MLRQISLLLVSALAFFTSPAFAGDEEDLIADIQVLARCSGGFEGISQYAPNDDVKGAYLSYADSIKALALLHGEFAAELGVDFGKTSTQFVEDQIAYGRDKIDRFVQGNSQVESDVFMGPCVPIIKNIQYFEILSIGAADALASIGIGRPGGAQEFVDAYPNSSFSPLFLKKMSEAQ